MKYFFSILGLLIVSTVRANDTYIVNTRDSIVSEIDTIEIIKEVFNFLLEYREGDFFGSDSCDETLIKDTIFNGKYLPAKVNNYSLRLVDSTWLRYNCLRDSMGCLYTEIRRFELKGNSAKISISRQFESWILEVNYVHERLEEWVNVKLVNEEGKWIVKKYGKTIIE